MGISDRIGRHGYYNAVIGPCPMTNFHMNDLQTCSLVRPGMSVAQGSRNLEWSRDYLKIRTCRVRSSVQLE